MSSGERQVYEFEGFLLDANKRLLIGENSEVVPLMPKALDILLHLVERAGTVVEKDELMSSIWPDTIVEENNLTQNISALRRVLGEKHRENRFIATVPGRGYKFVAAVRPIVRDEITEAIGGYRRDEDPGTAARIPVKGGDTGRPWLIGLALFVLIGLTSAGFVYYWENPKMSGGAIRSIAVLPFKPITAENRDEALEIGMADTLILKLGGGDQLKVRPLAAVRRFALPDQDVVEAGRQLGVEAVLDGGVQIAGSRVRVSAKLVRVNDGHQIWAGQFDEQLTDIFSVQDSISERVAVALRVPLGSKGRKSYTANVEAYQLYMRGKLHARRLILPEVQKGISYYEQAIAIDPTYALAYVELANAYRAMALTNDARPDEIMPKALAAAVRAIELDDTLSEAWTALAVSDFFYSWNWQAAEEHGKKGIDLNPGSAQAHGFYAHLLSNVGRHEESLVEIKRAREIEPHDLLINAIEGQILCLAGYNEESLKVLRATIDLDPNFWLAHLFISRNYLKDEKWDAAIASATKASELSAGNAEAMGLVGYALAKAGRLDESRRVLAEMENRAQGRFVPAYTLAGVHLGLGSRNEALDLLEKAFEQREPLMVFLKVEPKWDELRAERRFIELMKRMNFE